MIVFLSDFPPPRRFCRKGIRAFFNKQGWDYSDFLRNGIDSEIIRATGDAMAIEVADHAEKVRHGKR